jgi:hypothetical protein
MMARLPGKPPAESLAQTNATVGDLAGNLAPIRAARAKAPAAGADLSTPSP